MRQSEQIGSLVTALAKAQGEIRNPALDSVNPHFKNRYASLGAHLDAIRVPFAKNGLVLTQAVESEDGRVSVTTMVAHASSEWMASTVSMPLPDRATAQNLGAIVTYLRRYAIASVALLTGEEDDDGDADRTARQPQHTRVPAAPAPAPAPTPAPAAREALFGSQPVKPAAKPAAKAKSDAPMTWTPDGTEVVTMRKVVQRDGGSVAVLCEHPDYGTSWVQFGADIANAAVEGKRAELTWDFNERGAFLRAVEVRAAPRMTEGSAA